MNWKTLGICCIAAGILMLAVSIVLACTLDTILVPVLFWLSIPVNTAGIIMVRNAGKKE